MIKVMIDGIEMQIVGVRKDRLLCEYIQVTELTDEEKRIFKKERLEHLRKPSFKIYKNTKGYYIQRAKRIYIDDELKRYFYQSLGNEFIASMLTTSELTKFLSKRGGVDEYYGDFEDSMKLSVENFDGRIEEYDLVTPAKVLHIYD